MFINCKIAGTAYRDIESQVRAARLHHGEELVLVPEPDNPHDPFAVKVMSTEGLHLGYVPRAFSAPVAAAITAEEQLRVAAGALSGTIVIESLDATDA